MVYFEPADAEAESGFITWSMQALLPPVDVLTDVFLGLVKIGWVCRHYRSKYTCSLLFVDCSHLWQRTVKSWLSYVHRCAALRGYPQAKYQHLLRLPKLTQMKPAMLHSCHRLLTANSRTAENGSVITSRPMRRTSQRSLTTKREQKIVWSSADYRDLIQCWSLT